MKDAWLHAASLKLHGRTRSNSTAEVNQNGDSSSDTEGQAEDNPVGVSLNNRESVAKSLVYDKFLRFLELGCGGSPSQGYPTLVVILSTIPSEVRSSRHFVACNNPLNSQIQSLLCTEGVLQQLFASIWAAFDGKALSASLERERRENTAAFVSAVSECTAVYARMVYFGTPECTLPSDERISLGLRLVREQWSRLWSETLGGRFGLPLVALGSVLGRSLLRLRIVASGATRPLKMDLS